MSLPTTLEALPVPIRAARAWLNQVKETPVADIEGQLEPSEKARPQSFRKVLRWRGPDDVEVASPDQVRPGDTIVVPAEYGGADEYGWEPNTDKPVKDVGDLSALLSRGKPVLRIHPAVIADWQPAPQGEDGELLKHKIQELLRPPTTQDDDNEFEVNTGEILATLAAFPNMPPWVKLAGDELIRDTRKKISNYDSTGGEQSFVARGSRRLSLDKLREIVEGSQLDEDGELHADIEPDGPNGDDSMSFRDSRKVTLGKHCTGVAAEAARFASAVGLPKHLVSDLELAGLLHDLGKVDTRFQVWLRGGDETAESLESEPLAKSTDVQQGRASVTRARRLARYPEGARHEALSVAMATNNPNLLAGIGVGNLSLVRHLVGTHHGWGRPFWPIAPDPENPTVTYKLNRERPFWPVVPDVESQAIRNGLDSLCLSSPARHGFERIDSGWTDQFWRMVLEYGPWGLALLEAILILADHHRSRSEQEDRS